MANSEGREALRGAEAATFDLIAEALSSEEWVKLLAVSLTHAVIRGNRSLAQKLVRAGAEIQDALHEAVQGGHGGIVNDLLENGASVTAKDRLGRTPLHVAAGRGEKETVQLLLQKGADKDAQDNSRRTPLYIAVSDGHAAAAFALLAVGADVHFQCGPFQWSVVHAAAQNGLLGVLRAAIERGADLEARDNENKTACHFAAFEGKATAINVLAEAGANVNVCTPMGETPLHLACGALHLEAVRALVAHGAHVNAQDRRNFDTPLHSATNSAGEAPAAEVVDFLLRSGADETILDTCDGTPADLIGYTRGWLLPGHLVGDIERLRKLLANAPADRAWRRRGYLAMCRAFPDRLQLRKEIFGLNLQRRTAARGCSETPVGDSTVDEKTVGDWAGLVARVLGLREDDMLRKIVGYL